MVTFVQNIVTVWRKNLDKYDDLVRSVMLEEGRRGGKPALAPARLPEELATFLTRDTYSLIIKGAPGSGKSILALTILKSLQPIENVLYISTRTSPLQLFEYYPWIDEIFGPPGPLAPGGDEGWENLVDSRLDEPNAVFEHVTNVLMDKQAPTVVIDSWEALGDSLGSEALRTNLRVLETWRERAGARFIFIGEDPSNAAIDYMVEGVTVLKDRTEGGRRLREIQLTKLHGIQIRKPTYFFSLEGGSFRSFPRYSPDDYDFRNPLKVSLDRPLRKAKSRIPIGYPALDSLLKGGFPRKSLVFFEIEEGVDPKVGLIILEKMVQNWTSSGGRVLLQRPPGVSQQYVARFSKSFLTKGKESRAVILDSKDMDHDSPATDPKGAIAILSPTTGRGPSQPDLLDRIAGRAELTVVLGPPSSGSSHPGSLIRLSVSQIEGTLFVKSESPWTPLLGVIPETTAGNPVVQLEPVV